MSDVAIRIRGACKRYGSLQALDHVDLEVRRGEFFGLLGPNGAGKTTLISSLSGLVRPDAGTLEVMGHDVVTDYRNARRLDGSGIGVQITEALLRPRAARTILGREMLRSRAHLPSAATSAHAAGGRFSWK